MLLALPLRMDRKASIAFGDGRVTAEEDIRVLFVQRL
jgi:hypothetical protein